MRKLALLSLALAGPAFAEPAPSTPTIAFCLNAIHDSALTALSRRVIAIEGLRGLATIDPALDVAIDAEHRLTMRLRNRRLASYSLPAEEDGAGWVGLIIRATAEAARHSSPLARADSDHLTEAVIDGFLSKLDIFSHYAGPEEARQKRANRSGTGDTGLSVNFRIEEQIGIIAITSFNQNTAAAVLEAIRKIKLSVGLKGIILDLRGDFGGLLDQAIAVADYFIEKGPILSTSGRDPMAAQSQMAEPGDAGEQIKLVLLIDGRTASAAEILAADLQDSGHAVLVGTNSFGKGAIQTVLELPNHGEMTLTWSRFFAPSGYALHGLGLLPSICTALEGKIEGDRKMAGGRVASREVFAAWRAIAPDNMAGRTRLRAHCPAADHQGDRADLTIGKHLLNDSALYDRALAAAAPSTAGMRFLQNLPIK